MADTRLYTVRPFSKPARPDLKDVFRVYASPATLLLHGIQPGQLCFLRTAEGICVPAIAWNALEKIQDTIVQTSKTLQSLHGIKLGDKVSIERRKGSIKEAGKVVLSEILAGEPEKVLTRLDGAQLEHWAWFLEHPLRKAEVLCVGMIIEAVELKGERRSFQISEIDDSASSENLYIFESSSTNVCLQDDGLPPDSQISAEAAYRSLLVSRERIGGLSRQLDQLDQRLSAYADGLQKLKLPKYYRSRRGGILLYGPPGTGKSLILNEMKGGGWRKVFEISTASFTKASGHQASIVNQVFQEARRHQPSLIVIDRLDLFAGKSGREENNGRSTNIAPDLCEELSRLGDARVVVIAATTALRDVDESLRRPGCLELQIEIPIPDSKTRAEILKIITHQSRAADDQKLDVLGDRTHGFVGADLDKLIQLAVDKAKARTLAANRSFSGGIAQADDTSDTTVSEIGNHQEVLIEVDVTETDLNNALLEVRPTAMQEVFLETPKVRWSDIGGQHAIKKSLKQAVEWPFKYPEEMTRLGIDPKKGLLLYGPPGCSKTLIAKAVATEAGLNFLAVKGAELLSMYVGESERNLREVFRKARAASPSIVFFDEIDALGASRDGSNSGSNSSSGSGHGGGGGSAGLNVLTTLLNELDGIEALKGVFVLAATNKPEVLDAALMRPGRLDTMLYVGPPDYVARLEILQIRTRRMDVVLAPGRGGAREGEGKEEGKEAEGKTEAGNGSTAEGDDRDQGVDLADLARRTEGYSGAELISVCQKAGYAALEEWEERGGQAVAAVAAAAGAARALSGQHRDQHQRIVARHFDIALREVRPQISAEMRARYQAWARGVAAAGL